MTLAIRRHRLDARVAAFLLAALMLVAGVPAAEALGRLVSLVVTGRDAATAATAVRAQGGRVDATLPIVDGVAARVPESRIDELESSAVVVPDRVIRVQSASFGDELTTAYPHEVGATALWEDGVTGRGGPTVAVLDTGVANHPDIEGNVVARVNLSDERDTPYDRFGHGTFMAGVIAGNGASSNGRYVGVAPEANIFAVKVAGREGTTSLARVLMGVQVIDSARRTHDIRVMLLAADSESPLPPDMDPLSTALRKAWAHGIVVVVPAGNDGEEGAGSIASPGEDPVLLTAGSVNDMGTPDVADDEVSDFSGVGPTRWSDQKPDVTAPGEHIVSLRAEGSYIDETYSTARVEDAYFRGSGTSMSSAVTAGAAALLLTARPELSPDDVKAMLMATATPIPDGDLDTVGAGVVDAAAAAESDSPGDLPPVPDVDDAPPVPHPSDVDRPDFKDLDPEARRWAARQWRDEVFEARRWAARQWAARRWAARQWAARQWAARRWTDEEWAARQWAARQWAARQWTFEDWAARQWTARQWTARQWSADDWDARRWQSDQWSARQWTEADWVARQWSARQWSARQWSARQWSARQWNARQWNARQWNFEDWAARQWSARQWNVADWG